MKTLLGFVHQKALPYGKAFLFFLVGSIANLAQTHNRTTVLDGIHNGAEDIADRGAEQGKNNNHDNRDQNKNQRIFNEALTFLLRSEQHDNSPPFHLCVLASIIEPLLL